ncbi:hypothetical protein BGZ73_004727 [Actinomortierella ambigua]|nr:hypothetical protein BGZ73_004727 [Actinomortierella ambigua]
MKSLSDPLASFLMPDQPLSPSVTLQSQTTTALTIDSSHSLKPTLEDMPSTTATMDTTSSTESPVAEFALDQDETTQPPSETAPVSAYLRPLPNHFHQHHRYGRLLIAEPISPESKSHSQVNLQDSRVISPLLEPLSTSTPSTKTPSPRPLSLASATYFHDRSLNHSPIFSPPRFIRGRQKSVDSSACSSLLSSPARNHDTASSSAARSTPSSDHGHRRCNTNGDSIPGTRAFLNALSGREFLLDHPRRPKGSLNRSVMVHSRANSPIPPSTPQSLYSRSLVKCPPQLHSRHDSISSIASSTTRYRQDTQTTLNGCTATSNTADTAAWSSSFGTVLQKIATQRAQLQSLELGAGHLQEDVEALNETLEVENEVKGELVEDAQEAIEGWEGAWLKYDRCVSVEALQRRPNQVIDLVRDMDWQFKRVCKGWYDRVMTYGTLKYAIDRFTQIQEVVDVAAENSSRSNWNKLCRVYQREMSWRKGKPVRIDELNGHTNYVTSIKDRGGWIVSGGYDEVVCLWEAATGNCSRIWHFGSAVSCVELFVDSKMDGGGVVVAAFVDVGCHTTNL